MILTVIVGAPGSGKSTWAKAQPGAQVFCMDDYVEPVVARAWTDEEYADAKKALLRSVTAYLTIVDGAEHVIVDSTGQDPDLRMKMRVLCEMFDREAWLLDLRHLEVAEVLRRNAARGNGTPDDVVRQVYAELVDQPIQSEMWDGIHNVREPEVVW